MKNLSGLLAVLAIFLCASISYGQTNYVKRINCGSLTSNNTSYMNESFTADTQATGFTTTADRVSNNLSYNGLTEPLKSIRFTKNQSMNYNFTGLPSGTYTVKLHFTEVYWGVVPGHGATERDKRHFSIDIDSQWDMADYNIFNESGGDAFHTISEDITVNDGNILITLSAIGTGSNRKNDPVISAIEILEIPPADIPVSSVSLNPATLDLEIGNNPVQLAHTIMPSDASDPSISGWTSSNTSVASVNNGLVTPLEVGNATITVTTTNGSNTATTEVFVTDPNIPPSGGGNWSLASGNVYRSSGNVGIGTTNAVPTNGDPNYLLAVKGSIRAEEIKVETDWADYVFFKDYKLPTLEEVEKHIQDKGHLINIPSAAEVEANGIELGEMNKLLLEKIEELTLYILEQDKAQKELKTRLDILEKNK